MHKSVFEIEGSVRVILTRFGEVIADDTYHNLHTDQGDLYVAQKVIAGVGTTATVTPALINGVKLGTGAVTGGNTPSKAGAGAALTTYLAASNRGLDNTWPQIVDLGSTLGKQAEYQVTYPAGILTSATPITEAALVTDSGADLTSATSQTIARSAVGPYVKDVNTQIQVIWHQLYKGV